MSTRRRPFCSVIYGFAGQIPERVCVLPSYFQAHGNNGLIGAVASFATSSRKFLHISLDFGQKRNSIELSPPIQFRIEWADSQGMSPLLGCRPILFCPGVSRWSSARLRKSTLINSTRVETGRFRVPIRSTFVGTRFGYSAQSGDLTTQSVTRLTTDAGASTSSSTAPSLYARE